MLATAFHILHFRKFLEDTGPMPASLVTKLATFQDEPSPDEMESLEMTEEYLSFMMKYAGYMELTLAGAQGSTAQFWMIYIQAVHVYLLFHRACRTNDLDLFIYALGQMRYSFFAGSRPNYARWMVRYHMNLLNVDKTHPGVREVLQKGALSIRRTDKSFSRAAVDITLEQTVNADAASRKTGITAFGTDGARQRWMVTRSVRSAIVGNLMTKAGLKPPDDAVKELMPHRIKVDTEDMNKIIDGIQSRMNPFNLEGDDNLYCLSTGKNLKDQIKDELLAFNDTGKKWCQEFLDGCLDDPQRFEKPIKRRKVKNFTSGAIKTRIKGKLGKLIEVTGTRDLFGRMLFLSTVEKLDIEKVFKFPLTPVPLTLSTVDGFMNKTDKSKLMIRLTKTVEKNDPVAVDVTLVDAMFQLHALMNLPSTFGEVALSLLHILCQMSRRVDFICDTYQTPSIKDAERTLRKETDHTETVYIITGPQQTRPKDWQEALKLSSFKTSLCRFLVNEWCNDCYATVLEGHELYIALEEECYSYTVIDGAVHQEEVPTLQCQHEEADTRIMFHLSRIIAADPQLAVSVRCNDTDVLVLLLYHVMCLKSSTVEPQVWMDVGHSSNNTRHYINICDILALLDKSVIQALPGIHAMTGCDFTASFLGKGKDKPFNLMLKNNSHVEAMAKLGESEEVTSDLVRDIGRFVCALYGLPKVQKVDDARFASFQQKYAPMRKNQPLGKIKGINQSSMPPCQAVLLNKIRRANFISYLWKRARLPVPCVLKPEDHGWQVKDSSYIIKWYDGPQLPQYLADILYDESDDEEESDVEYESSDDSDDQDDD